MSRVFQERIDAKGGIQLPAGAALGKVATSDASGNITWQTATGGPANPRAVLDDNCAAAALPTGVVVSGAGTVAYDATRMGRTITNAKYAGPAQALNGPLIWEIDVEMNNAFATGNCMFGLARADTAQNQIINFQNDGNIVIYNWPGAVLQASGAAQNITGRRFRISAVISDLTDGPLAAQALTAFIGESLALNYLGSSTWGGKFAAGGVAVPAGTNISPFISTDGTRQVTVYHARFYRGAI